MSKKKNKTSERIPIPDVGLAGKEAEKPKAKDPATSSSDRLAPVKSREPEKVKLNYTDPGAERKLPEPPHISIGPGDRVRLKKTQEYGDGTVQAGAEGFALNPSSQAACWCVRFDSESKIRVVPEWLLEAVGARAAAH